MNDTSSLAESECNAGPASMYRGSTVPRVPRIHAMNLGPAYGVMALVVISICSACFLTWVFA